MTCQPGSLFVDPNQGTDIGGKCFGFVGTNSTDYYQGWFFTWPDRPTSKSTATEAEAIISTLDPDSTCSHLPQIPRRFVEQRLREYLCRAKY